MTFRSTKTYGHEIGLSACFRQWRATHSHCRFLHGYALSIRFEFEADELDHNNWVMDFGGLKGLKAKLVETFDHKTLVAEDDPNLRTFKDLHKAGLIDMLIVHATGCEKFAELCFDMAVQHLAEIGVADRVRVVECEVREHGANSGKVTA